MATAFSFAMDPRQMNLLLVITMSITPLFLIIQYPFISKKETLIYLLIIFILLTSLFHIESFRISTVLYSFLFLFTFIYYYRLVSLLPLKIDKYIEILKFLIIAYFIVLVIQQFCVFLDSPYILNLILSDITIYKLNSLAPEPANAGIIIMVLMYSYISMQELKLGRFYNIIKDGIKDKFIWFTFLYPMLTMGSGFAIVMLLVFFLKYIEIKKIIYILPFLIVAFIIVLNLNLSAVERVIKFGEAFFKLDAKLMIEVDHSASIRVVPTFLYINMFDIKNINIWLGYGTDYSAYLIPTLMPGIQEGGFLGGLFPVFFIDKGLICVVILFTMIYVFCLNKIFSFDTFILLLLIFAAGTNTQLFWISIFLFTTNKCLYQTYYSKVSNAQIEK